MTLTELLPAVADPDSLFDAFTGWAEDRGLELYPAQEEALIEVVSLMSHAFLPGRGQSRSWASTRRPMPPFPALFVTSEGIPS